MRQFKVFSAAAFLMGSWLLMPALVQAKKKVVILYFKGDKKAYKPVRNYIRYIILPKVEEKYEYVTKKELSANEGQDVENSSEWKTWWKEATKDQLAELAKKQAVSIYIGGEGRKEGKWKYVTVIIYKGKGFEEVARKEFKFRRTRKQRVTVGSKKKRKRFPDPKTQDEIGVWGLQNRENIEEYIPEEEEEQKPVEQVEDKEAETVLKEEEKDEPVAPTVKKAKPIHDSTLWKLRAGLTIDLFNRNLEFSPSSEPYLKTTGLTPMPTVNIEAYPLTFFMKDNSLLTGLGVTFDLGAVFGFKTHPANNSDQDVDTTIVNMGFGISWRYHLGPVWLMPRFEYRKFQWTYKTPSLIDSPEVEYSYLEPSMGAAFQTLSNRLTIDGRLGIALPMAVGAIADGAYYGEASAFGLHAELGAYYLIMPSLEAGAGFRWFQMNLDFNGKGVRNADSATDSLLSILLTVRYYYR